jgi:hypothetical protein
MKLVTLLLVFSFNTFSQSQTTTNDLLEISRRVQDRVEYNASTMSAEQRNQIARRLLAIERLLSSGQSVETVACIRHSSSYMGYALTKVSNNQRVSIAMNLNDCRRLLRTQKNSILCTKSKESYLGYQPYNLNTGISYGVNLDINECSSIVQGHNRGLICAKMSYSYTGYRITRLSDGGILGGFYNLVECLGQIR